MSIQEVIDEWCRTTFPQGVPTLFCDRCGKAIENFTCPQCSPLIQEKSRLGILEPIATKIGWSALGVFGILMGLAMPFTGWGVGFKFGGKQGATVGCIVGLSVMYIFCKEGFSFLSETTGTQAETFRRKARSLAEGTPEQKRVAAWCYANYLLYPRITTRISPSRQSSIFNTIREFVRYWRPDAEADNALRNIILDLLSVELIYHVYQNPEAYVTVFDENGGPKDNLRTTIRGGTRQIAFVRQLISKAEPRPFIKAMTAGISKEIESTSPPMAQELLGIEAPK